MTVSDTEEQLGVECQLEKRRQVAAPNLFFCCKQRAWSLSAAQTNLNLRTRNGKNEAKKEQEVKKDKQQAWNRLNSTLDP
jgi:hypothetical protein